MRKLKIVVGEDVVETDHLEFHHSSINVRFINKDIEGKCREGYPCKDDCTQTYRPGGVHWVGGLCSNGVLYIAFLPSSHWGTLDSSYQLVKGTSIK